MSQKSIWDNVYQKYSPDKLPWTNIIIPTKVMNILNKFNKQHLLIMPGCGTGESVNQVRTKGFKNLVGTDISNISIEKAKKSFNKLDFRPLPTEIINQEINFPANSFDWLNLHQINFQDLKKYLESLEKISEKLLITYIYEPFKGEKRESYITGDYVYNHNPKNVELMLKKMLLLEKFDFEFEINPEFGKEKHKAVALYFERKNKIKTMGILGGLGPQSTQYFYSKIIKICQKNHNSVYPNILINNIPLWDIVDLLDKKEKLIEYLVKEIKKIDEQIDFLVIPCNGMHFVIEELRKKTKVPIVAIHEEVAKKISKDKLRKVAILGTKATTKNNFYNKELKKYEIECIGLEEKNEDNLSDIIFDEILPGKNEKNMKKIILDYISKIQDSECEGIVLACTELPIFVSSKDTKRKLYSSTDILAESCVKKIFNQE